MCNELPAIENGMISYAPDSEGPEYELDTIATYSCNVGYMLIGSPERTCESSGNFSGVAPMCSLMRKSILVLPVIFFGFCVLMRCA